MTSRLQAKTKTNWKTQYNIIESASKFHNKVREIFATDTFFKYMKCYQEVNVNDLIEDYPHRSHHFDWYIDELRTVIELHGEQHYKMVNYGNIGYDEAKRNFFRMKDRDNMKKLAAETAGFTYVEISYRHAKDLDASKLKHLMFYGDENE